ncbi:MAG: trypsin-like peptidase domain-containing protein [Tannerella sp.]|jgi:hypothetical protein|nr:trypsin-like peptidase domain-containing protein [Tannerella sp.]
MKKILLLTTVSLFVCALHAQITTNEMPYGLKNVTAVTMANKQNVNTLPAPNRAAIAREDSVNDSQPGPVRYAYPVEVNFTPANSGVWQELEDGSKIWRLKVKLSGALSTNALYDKFWLPEGAKFFVYSEDTEQYIGAITSEYIGGSRENPIAFATAIIYGESAVFEYYQPASVSDSAVISISRIDYGYRYVNNPYANVLLGFGDSGSCQVNINCSEGNNWQTEKHAVAKVNVVGPDGSSWCSCALVNNTNNDLTPYVLTADHCLKGLDAISNNNASQWVFYWEYESSGCNNSATEPTLRTTTGATVVANNSVSDFALVRLTQNPCNVSGVTPYYLGWDRSGSAGTSAVGIHHPAGDVKKISTLNNATTSSGNFWQHYWNQTTNGYSVTEGGSSGSPLINNYRRVIGQLYGGTSVDCTNPSQDLSMYGKFNVSWTGNSASDNRRKLQPWLDPAGTNPNTLNGMSIPTVSITSGPSLLCPGSSGTFTASGSSTSYIWTCSSYLTPGTASGNSKTFTAKSGSDALGWVAVNLSSVELARKEVWVGNPYDIPNQVSVNMPLNTPTVITPSLTAYQQKMGITSFYWVWNQSNGATLGNSYGATATVTLKNNGTSTLHAYGINSCGGNTTGAPMFIYNISRSYSSSSYLLSAYPNPVSSVLNVQLEEQELETASSSSGQQRVTGSAPVYTIRLYNAAGTPVLQTTANDVGTVQLNVGSLPNGIYTLHVHDGTDSPPLTQHIVISHGAN